LVIFNNIIYLKIYYIAPKCAINFLIFKSNIFIFEKIVFFGIFWDFNTKNVCVIFFCTKNGDFLPIKKSRHSTILDNYYQKKSHRYKNFLENYYYTKKNYKILLYKNFLEKL